MEEEDFEFYEEDFEDILKNHKIYTFGRRNSKEESKNTEVETKEQSKETETITFETEEEEMKRYGEKMVKTDVRMFLQDCEQKGPSMHLP